MKFPEHISSGRVHAYVAVAVLLIAAVGWNVLLYGKYFAKKPVPPPAHVEVQDHRLYNFPKSFGDFELAPEAEGESVAPEKRDGIHEPTEEVLDVLGTLKHEWNWYYMATYRDARVLPSLGWRHMRLDVTYYTGLLEAVPHVGERCILVGGGRLLAGAGTVEVALTGLPQAQRKLWGNIKIERTPYEYDDDRTGGVTRGVQYHVFSVNGRPEHRWKHVRWEMGKLTLKYCYFAKIQLAPSGYGLRDAAACDAFCREFLQQAMPSILKSLPTAEDVEKLSTQ